MYFEEHGFSVTGLDISRKVISELNERFPSKDFMVGDIRNTGMEEGYYDACYSWGSLSILKKVHRHASKRHTDS